LRENRRVPPSDPNDVAACDELPAHGHDSVALRLNGWCAVRGWLGELGADRELYVRAKRDLVTRDREYVQQYAEARTEVIATIMARAGIR
jgi:GrpB-like predicted nucleotidyltransferase (UPF0157 family)